MTAREVRLARYVYVDALSSGPMWRGPTILKEHAAKAYPLPKVTRPRVWADLNGREFRFVDGQLQTRNPLIAAMEEWRCLSSGTAGAALSPNGLAITPERIKAWADLLANPTEEVEAEP